MTLVYILTIALLVGVWIGLSFHRLEADQVGIIERRVSLEFVDTFMSQLSREGTREGGHSESGDPESSWGQYRPLVAGRGVGILPEIAEYGKIHFRPWPVYRVLVQEVVRVPADTIALVEAIRGSDRTKGSAFPAPVSGGLDVRDARAFLERRGEVGWQLEHLTAGTYEVNTFAFRVLTVNSAEDSPDVLKHRHGCTPSQLPIPKNGIFDALRPVNFGPDDTGVVISRAGKSPLQLRGEDFTSPAIEADHGAFEDAAEFVRGGGYAGVQAQYLKGGKDYYINPLFAEVEVVPSRMINLEWSEAAEKGPGNYDTSLTPLPLRIGGHKATADLSVGIRVPHASAPAIVERYGTNASVSDSRRSEIRRSQSGRTQRAADPASAQVRSRSAVDPTLNKNAALRVFVEQHVRKIVRGYVASLDNVLWSEFKRDFGDICHELEDELRAELSVWGVELGPVTLQEPTPKDESVYDEIKKLDQLHRDIEVEVAQRLLAEAKTDTRKTEIDLTVAEEEILDVTDPVTRKIRSRAKALRNAFNGPNTSSGSDRELPTGDQNG